MVDGVSSVHHQVISYMNFGVMETLHLINNTAVQFTSYPGGSAFGGFLWGGGSWMGTWKELIVRNNTIEGTFGQPLVLFHNGVHGDDPAIIDHNTFANTSLEVKFYRDGNNTRFTNNLFVNTSSGGQTHNSRNSNMGHGLGPGAKYVVVKIINIDLKWVHGNPI